MGYHTVVGFCVLRTLRQISLEFLLPDLVRMIMQNGQTVFVSASVSKKLCQNPKECILVHIQTWYYGSRRRGDKTIASFLLGGNT